MAKPNHIELGNHERLPILYEDRAALAIDKPPGWMLVPVSWQDTPHNLQAALLSSLQTGAFWARSRHLKFLRYVHRLDAETSGVLLLAKSHGALESLSALFEARRVEKLYLAVVHGVPSAAAWVCRLAIAPDPRQTGRMRTVAHGGKEAETAFRVLETVSVANAHPRTLIEARPWTGRTHQIRLHLAAAGHPVLGDSLYGPAEPSAASAASPSVKGLPPAGFARPVGGLGLRAVSLDYRDPFTHRPVRIKAPTDRFLRDYGFCPLATAVRLACSPDA